MKDLVSIIVPVYNAVVWLEECLRSLCEQSYNNIEIILVNDGSTDDSEQICTKWRDNDKRVKYIRQNNSGVSSARNRGISEAQGKYVCFIDSDDWVSSTYISDVLTTACAVESDLVISGIIHEFSTEKVILPPHTESVDKKDSRFENWLISILETGLLYSPCVSLYKMSIIKRYSLKFRDGVHYGEDRVFNLDYLHHCNTISTIRNANYHYRHEASESLSKIADERQLEITLFLYHENKRFCADLGFTSRTALQWLYTPLYDAYTNHILKLRSFYPKLGFYGTYKTIKVLIRNRECELAVKYANHESYPKFLTYLVKNKMAMLLTLLVLHQSTN